MPHSAAPVAPAPSITLPHPGYPPLSAPVLAILLALSSGELHGYAVMKQAALPPCGAVIMGPGTLYGSLDRMLRDRLVEETGHTDDIRRRYYRITATGEEVLAQELSRLAAALHGRFQHPSRRKGSRENAPARKIISDGARR